MLCGRCSSRFVRARPRIHTVVNVLKFHHLQCSDELGWAVLSWGEAPSNCWSHTVCSMSLCPFCTELCVRSELKVQLSHWLSTSVKSSWNLETKEAAVGIAQCAHSPVIGCKAASSDVLCYWLFVCDGVHFISRSVILVTSPFGLLSPLRLDHTFWNAFKENGPQLKCNTCSGFKNRKRLSFVNHHVAVCFSVCVSSAPCSRLTLFNAPPPNSPSVVTHRRTAIKLFARSRQPLSCASHHHFLSSSQVLTGCHPFFSFFFCA